jgi:hypothetical protein
LKGFLHHLSPLNNSAADQMRFLSTRIYGKNAGETHDSSRFLFLTNHGLIDLQMLLCIRLEKTQIISRLLLCTNSVSSFLMFKAPFLCVAFPAITAIVFADRPFDLIILSAMSDKMAKQRSTKQPACCLDDFTFFRNLHRVDFTLVFQTQTHQISSELFFTKSSKTE